MNISLSKSTLEAFKRCARCWWLEKRQAVKAPDGIRAGVPIGIDRVLKAHYDSHRALGTVPPELLGHIPGGLYDGKRISMADLRNWRKGLSVSIGGYELSTALDDLLFDPKTGLYNMIDYKSKAKDTDEADTIRYYQTQADAYDLALNANGYTTDHVAYFAYYAPQSVASGAPGAVIDFKWKTQVIAIKADHEAIKDLVVRAGKCLEGPQPDANEECDMCVYVQNRRKFHAGEEAPKAVIA